MHGILTHTISGAFAARLVQNLNQPFVDSRSTAYRLPGRLKIRFLYSSASKRFFRIVYFGVFATAAALCLLKTKTSVLSDGTIVIISTRNVPSPVKVNFRLTTLELSAVLRVCTSAVSRK